MNVREQKTGEALPLTTYVDALKLEREQLVRRAAGTREEAAKASLQDRVKQVDEQIKLRGEAPKGRGTKPSDVA